jgi:hypothetical protein
LGFIGVEDHISLLRIRTPRRLRPLNAAGAELYITSEVDHGGERAGAGVRQIFAHDAVRREDPRACRDRKPSGPGIFAELAACGKKRTSEEPIRAFQRSSLIGTCALVDAICRLTISAGFPVVSINARP